MQDTIVTVMQVRSTLIKCSMWCSACFNTNNKCAFCAGREYPLNSH